MFKPTQLRAQKEQNKKLGIQTCVLVAYVNVNKFLSRSDQPFRATYFFPVGQETESPLWTLSGGVGEVLSRCEVGGFTCGQCFHVPFPDRPKPTQNTTCDCSVCRRYQTTFRSSSMIATFLQRCVLITVYFFKERIMCTK